MFLSFDTANLSPLDRRVLGVLADPEAHTVYVEPAQGLRDEIRAALAQDPEAAIAEANAAPDAEGGLMQTIPPAFTPEPEAKPKRKRRTKAEMEAARAEAEVSAASEADMIAAADEITADTVAAAEAALEEAAEVVTPTEADDFDAMDAALAAAGDPDTGTADDDDDFLGDDPAPAAVPTFEEVRAVAKSLVEAGKQGRLRAILSALGAAKVPDLADNPAGRSEFMVRASKIAGAVAGE